MEQQRTLGGKETIPFHVPSFLCRSIHVAILEGRSLHNIESKSSAIVFQRKSSLYQEQQQQSFHGQPSEIFVCIGRNFFDINVITHRHGQQSGGVPGQARQ